MIADQFKDFPDNAPIWIFAFPEDLNSTSYDVVNATLSEFCTSWQSHGAPVSGRYIIYKSRFVIVTGVTKDDVSGCSKDSLMLVFKTLHIQHGLNALNDMLIHYEKDGKIHSITRSAFEDACNNGDVSSETTVYDCSLQTVAQLRGGRFESRFADSWHASAFALS